MLLRESDRDIENTLISRELRSLAPLLSVTSHANLGGEPRWLVFCDYLALAMSPGTFGHLGGDWVLKAIHELAQQMWGADALSREELAAAWFSVEKKDGVGRTWFAEREVIDRALAVAALAGRRLNWNCPGINPDDVLLPQEQEALLAFWANRYGPKPAVHMPVMLVDGGAAFGEQGRRAQLRLSRVRVLAEQHGQLFRAPAATLLSLRTAKEATFEEGLRKVQTLLQACLAPAGPEGGWGLLWSLHPEPMVLDRGDSQTRRDWGTRAITGPSATGAFVLAALWVMREQLNDSLPGMKTARQQLRDIQPSQMSISAQLRGDGPPDSRNPLGWFWDPITGLDEKLGSFVLDRKLLATNESPVTLVLVAGPQGCKGRLITPEPVDTVAQALETAYLEIGSPLPEAAEALRRFLLDQEAPFEEAQPMTPLAPPELIEPLRPETLRSNKQALEGPNRTEDIGKPNTIAWYLLCCYARWAGGDHILWGEPARLAEDFFPIRLETDAEASKSGELALNKSETGAKKLEARSLIQLLDTAFLSRQPPLWLLSASPAAGKTTMMAEYQLHHAYKALHQYALSGHFGVVPVWIPARELDPEVLGQGSLDQAINVWLQDNWPALGSLRNLLNQAHARVQVLLDGINELKHPADRRSTLLADWLTAHFGPNHHHRPPLLTVRSLELVRLKGALVAYLQPWDEGQQETYVQQRLTDQPEYLQAMQAALVADRTASKGVMDKMLYSSPGLLSLACTLMRQGLLPPAPAQLPMNRARLLSTLMWSRLLDESPAHSGNIPAALLGREERERLKNLEHRLNIGNWRPPETLGPLLAALAEQARHMQFDHASAEMELPEHAWWKDQQTGEERDAISQAAGHLGVVQSREFADQSGLFRKLLSFRHQLWLEYFAALGLSPGGIWPKVTPLMGTSAEEVLKNWLTDKAVRKQEGSVQKVNEDSYRYRLPSAAVSVHEEAFKLAAQLHGNPEEWVGRLIREGNVPLAARIALENWGAFGESPYPKDPIGPWQGEGNQRSLGGTNRVLNELRGELHKRMFDLRLNICFRLEAGDLLGKLGGTPRLINVGRALVLDGVINLLDKNGKGAN